MSKKAIKDLVVLLAILALLLFLDLPYINLVLSLGVILVYTWRGEGIKKELGLSWQPHFLKTILISIALASVIVCLSYLVVLPLAESLTGSKLQLGMFEQLKGNTNLLVISVALGWVVGGFIEELIFRAFLIGRVFNFIPTSWLMVLKVCISTVSFGYLHTYQGPSGQILTGFVGLDLAIIYLVNKKNIWLNIFTHGFVNTISMLLLYFISL